MTLEVPLPYGLRATYDGESRHLEVSRGDEVLLGRTVEPAVAVATDMWGLRTIRSDLLADPDWSDLFSDIVGPAGAAGPGPRCRP